MTEEIVKQSTAGAVVQRSGLQGREIQIGDNLSLAAQAQERAQIETAAMIASMKPNRDLDTFRATVMRTVEDPAIAATWFYRRPAGRKYNPATREWEEEMIEGPSIRAAEILMQAYGKLFESSRHIYEDRERVLLANTVIDLEAVNVESSDMMIEKTVERKNPREGQEVVGQRATSTGGLVYRVLASPDEIRIKVSAERSRLKRNGILAQIPRGIVDEIGLKVKSILSAEHQRDPNAARKKIFERFATLGITADMLKTYLDDKLETVTERHIDLLAGMFNSLKDGEYTWSELVAIKNAPAEGDATTEHKSVKLAEKLMGRKKAQDKPAAEPEQQTLTPDPPPPGA
jgi:hypothetical protein